MIDMQKLWDYLDAQARNIPVPKSYENCNVNIFCNDCCKVSVFHLSMFYRDINDEDFVSDDLYADGGN